MKKIIEEIIENTPELEKDRDLLWKTVKFLDENNPKIFPTHEFKKSLKSRISWLIKLKQNKKTNFLIFAIPVFSLMFVVAWFFYYFDEIDFLWNWKDVDLENVQKINLINTQSIDEEKNIEDNQVMEIYDAIKEEIGEPDEALLQDSPDMWTSQKRVWGAELFQATDNAPDVDSNDAWVMTKSYLSEDYIEPDFKKFCEQQQWELSWTWTLEKCIVNKKECLASQFINRVCDFEEIK
jgi:hypothetical protein